MPGASRSGMSRCTIIRRSGSANGSGLSSTALTSEKIATFAPIPMASISTAIAVNPGCLASDRSAYERSWRMAAMGVLFDREPESV